MALTQTELQQIVNAVVSSLRTNSLTIQQLQPVTMLSDSDSFEISGGKRVTYEVLRNLIMTLTSQENGSFEDLIKDAHGLMLALIDSIGQPDGLTPLDSNGLVPSNLLPGYVDDVLEFDTEYEVSNSDVFLGFFTEIPEDYADYTFDSNALHHLSVFQESGVYYEPALNKFFIGKTVYAYTSYSVVGAFVLLDDVDTSVYGNITDGGLITPVAGKIYVNKSNNNQYRWSGSQLTMLSVPVSIGENVNEAFSGYEGAKLKSRVESISSKMYDFQDMLYGFTTFNVTAYADDDTPMELEEALDFLPGTDVLKTAIWPNLGAEIIFLSDDGWKRYRYTQMFDLHDPDACRDPDLWELVVSNLSSGGASGGCDPHCAEHTTKIANLTTKANNALATANAAKTTADNIVETLEGLDELLGEFDGLIGNCEDRITALETSSGNSTAGNSDTIIFKELKATVADECGWSKGAYSKDGLTYCYPSSSSWLNVRCEPGVLITLPATGMTVGSVIRILDPRYLTSTEAQSAQKVRITPYNAASKIYGVAKANSDYWIELKGGYVELIILPGDASSNWNYNFAVKSICKN